MSMQSVCHQCVVIVDINPGYHHLYQCSDMRILSQPEACRTVYNQSITSVHA